MHVEFLGDSETLLHEDRMVIAEIAANAAVEAREWLPALPSRILLVVYSGPDVIPETGELGAALAPGLVTWTVDPTHPSGVKDIAKAELRAALLHEFHHLTRGHVLNGAKPLTSFMDNVVAEGLATAFERDVGGRTPPWATYSEEEVHAWVGELMSLPLSASYRDWLFEHPDGRRWIGYRAGTYIADKASRASGLSAAQLATTSTNDILGMAGFD